MASTTITVRLPEEKVSRLRQFAKRERKTLTDVIEDSVDRLLTSIPEVDNLSKLSYAIGKGKSGGTKIRELDFGAELEEKHRIGRL